MQESAVRFYSEFETGTKGRSLPVYYSTLYFGSLFMAGAVCLVVYIFAQLLFHNILPKDLRSLSLLLIFMVLSSSIYQRLVNFFRAEQRTKLLNTILVTHRYLGLSLALIFIFRIHKSVPYYYYGIMVAELAITFSLTLVFIKEKKLGWKYISFTFFKECLLFGFPLIGYELANFLVKSSDRYLIQWFLGIDSVGIYSAGSNLCLFLRDGLFFPVAYAITPLYLELWKKKGKAATIEFLSRVTNYLLFLVIPIIFGFAVLAKQVIVLLASAKFEQSAQVIPFILPGALFWGMSPLYAAGLYIFKQTKKLTLVVFIGVAVNIILNIVLIPQWGLSGAAVATLFTYLLLTYLLIRVSGKYMRVEVNFERLTKYIIAAAVMAVVLTRFNFNSDISAILLEIVLGGIVYLSVILLIDKNIRSGIYANIQKHFATT